MCYGDTEGKELTSGRKILREVGMKWALKNGQAEVCTKTWKGENYIREQGIIQQVNVLWEKWELK